MRSVKDDDVEVARLVWFFDPSSQCWVIANRIAMSFASGWSAQVVMQSQCIEEGSEYITLFETQGWKLLWQDVSVHVTLRSQLMAAELDDMEKLQTKAES